MNRCNLQGSRASRGLASDPYTNLVIAIPHAVGKPFDVDWNGDTAAAVFRDRFTDWETDNLFSVSMKGVSIVSCPMSRLDVDVERLEEEGDRICNYEHVADSPQTLSSSQCNGRLAEWFSYRARLMLAAAEGDRPLILDCHSFPGDLAADVDICIGFNGDGTRPSDRTINAVTGMFRAAGYEVAHNRPYGNAIAPLGYRGHSLMIEVNKRCYLGPDERHIGGGFDRLRQTLVVVYGMLLGTSSNQ